MHSSTPTLHTRAIEANKVKELIIRTMVTEGYISREKAEDFLSKYTVIEHKKGFLGQTIDRLLLKNCSDSDSFYRIAKLLH